MRTEILCNRINKYKYCLITGVMRLFIMLKYYVKILLTIFCDNKKRYI